MAAAHYNLREYRRNRAAILASGPACTLCGLPGADTADHIVPASKGGTASLDNLRPAHRSCNSSRGARTVNRFRAGY